MNVGAYICTKTPFRESELLYNEVIWKPNGKVWKYPKKGGVNELKKLRLLLEYGAYLIWLYDKDGELRDFVRISSEGYFYCEGLYDIRKYTEEKLIGQYELESITNYINNEYPKCFINNEYEFSPKGFDSKEDEQRFVDAVRYVYKKLCELLGDDYEIINDTGYVMSEQDNESVIKPE